MALAREATDAEPESAGALRISEPVLVGEQPADEAQQGAAAADESAGQDRATGLFAGLRHGETEAAVEWRTRREAAVTRIEDELERAYAACLEARGYTVNPRP
jgi:hypothetical protein